jgi:ATP-dependent Lon protease
VQHKTLPPRPFSLELVQQILGRAKVHQERALRTGLPGVATGLAWTQSGGSILFVEAMALYKETMDHHDRLVMEKMTTTTTKNEEDDTTYHDLHPPPPPSSSVSSSSTSKMELCLTGALGDIMKESAHLALTWCQGFFMSPHAPAASHAHQEPSCASSSSSVSLSSSSSSSLFSFPRPRFDNIASLHVHFPHGATPKDGPSAGIAIVCAIISVG